MGARSHDGTTDDGPRALLAAQVEAWNRGDIEAFCATCSEDVVYVGSRGAVVGRSAVARNYRERYPDRAAMGTLSLELDRVDQGDDRAVVVARWRLRGDRDLGGTALLVLGRRDGRWWLTHDATLADLG